MLAQVGKIVGRILVAVGITTAVSIISDKIVAKITGEDREEIPAYAEVTPKYIHLDPADFTVN